MTFDDVIGHSPDMMALRMRLTRKALGLTQVSFAEGAGLKGNAIANYETGEKRPSVDSVAALRKKYRLSADWIFFGDPSTLPYELADKISKLLLATDRLD